MQTVPMDTAFFRTVAVNHNAVLSLALTLADRIDARSMRALLPVFADEMKTSKFYESNAVGSVELNHGMGGKPTTFNQLFVQVLRPTSSNQGVLSKAWNSDQEDFFQDVWPIAQRNDQSLHGFLIDACKHVHDPRFLQLFDRTKNDTAVRMMVAACAGGNMVVLNDLIEHIDPKDLNAFGKNILPGLDFTGGDVDALKGLTEVFTDSADGRQGILQMMSRFNGGETADTWRQEFLHRQLALFEKNGKPWSMDAIVEVMGAKDEAHALETVREWSHAFVQKEPAALSNALNFKTYAFARLLEQALRSHCAPLVGAMGEVFQAGGANTQCMQHVFRGPLQNVSNYKNTLLELQVHGHNLNGTLGNDTRKGYVPALVLLAKEPDGPDRDAKLAGLLDLGVAPSTDAAKSIKDTPARQRWKSVVASHTARKTAHNLIDEMDLDNSKAPSP